MINVHQHNDDEAIFVGIEYEGTHKGDRTLFVKNCPPFELILSLFAEHQCKRFYFGAGRLSSVQPATVNKLINAGYPATVEVDSTYNFALLPDAKLLTVHCTLHMPDVTTARKIPTVSFKHTTFLYKVDVGSTCFFFPQIESLNLFDNYPEDKLLHFKAAPCPIS